MSPSAHVSIAAALIAGGQSRRMGQDKARLDWQGMALWQVQINKLAGLHPVPLILSCREEQALVCPGAAVLFDPPGNQGPLPALERCLEQAQKSLLVLAVDMPHVTIALLEEIVAVSVASGQGVIFHGACGYEPLCALYPFAVLPLLKRSLEEGNLRLQVFAQQAVDAGLLNVIPLSKEREVLFLNLNTPADLPV